MTMDTIEAGREAWRRLQGHQRTAWCDWKLVGEALKAGRDAALLAADAETPHGTTYTRIFGTWLRQTGFDEITQQVRYRLLQCMGNIVAIEKFRATLDEATRNSLNHPDSVWFAWRRHMDDGARRAVSRPSRPRNASAGNGSKATKFGYHRPLRFDQDMIRRAATAMRSNWSSDTFKLAAIALAAAIRHEGDLLELLPGAPQPKPAPLQITAPAVLEHA